MAIIVNEDGILKELTEINVNEGGVIYRLDVVHANAGGGYCMRYSAGCRKISAGQDADPITPNAELQQALNLRPRRVLR